MSRWTRFAWGLFMLPGIAACLGEDPPPGPWLTPGALLRANCLLCHDNNGRGGSQGSHDFDGQTECVTCHQAVDFNAVPHIEIQLVKGICDVCHGYPPMTGAHRVHYDFSGPQSDYGDVTTVANHATAATTTYRFGCGSCHPTGKAHHLNRQLNAGGGDAELELFGPGVAGPKGQSPRAEYEPGNTVLVDDRGFRYTAGTCRNIYCHSNGRANETARSYQTVRFDATLRGEQRCRSCHDSPPRYASGDPATGDGNAHYDANAWGTGQPGGHVLGIHWNHGTAAAASDTIITCDLCHQGTVTTPFLASPDLPQASCGAAVSACHGGGANGDVPLWASIADTRQHVNGRADVQFSDITIRTSLRPRTGTLAPFVPNGRLDEAPLGTASYDPQTHTCSNVACHLNTQARWGREPNRTYHCEVCHAL